MACLFQRQNGYWYIVSSIGKKRQWISCGTRSQQEADAIFAEHQKGSRGRCPARISGFRDEFEANASVNYSAGTRYLYRHCLDSLIRVIGDKPIKFVTSKDVEAYKTARVRQVSPVSVNVEFRTLKAAFNVALRWGIVQENVFAKCNPLRVPLKEPAYFTKVEFERLLRAVEDNELRSLFLFAVSTMMRRGEILSLRWEDVDFNRKVIHVRNREDFTVKGHRPRVVPMNEKVCQLLRTKQRNSHFVFVSNNGNLFKACYISHRFKFYVRKCGLSEALHFHSLRHTGATWLVQQDVPLYAVQKILGHTSPLTTQIYSHLSEPHLHAAIDRIDFQLPPIVSN